MVLLLSFFGIAQNTYFILEGRSSALSTIHDLANGLNLTNYPIHANSNNLLGDSFNYSFVHNGKTIASQRIHLSNSIVLSIQRHLANPFTGESLMSVCGSQGSQFMQVNRKALEIFQQDMENLAYLAKQRDNNFIPFTERSSNEYETAYVAPALLRHDFTSPYTNLNTQIQYKEKTWMGKNWWWVVPLGAAVVSGGTYLILESGKTPPTTNNQEDEYWGPQTNSIVLIRW